MYKSMRQRNNEAIEKLQIYLDNQTIIENIICYFDSDTIQECFESIARDYEIELEDEEESEIEEDD